MPEILIADHDAEHCRQLASYLGGNGFVVHTAQDSKAMSRALAREDVALVILDAHMPDGAGLATCRRLAETGGPPVIMMGVGHDEIDRIVGLEVGADDYMNKPVHPRELLARVRVVVRRSAGATPAKAPASHVSRGFELDVLRRQMRGPDGDVLRLTPTEVSILTVFMERKGEPVSRADLKELALRDDRNVLDRAVDTQVSRLRRKLNAFSGIDVIQTVYGMGYIWDSGAEGSSSASPRVQDPSRSFARRDMTAVAQA